MSLPLHLGHEAAAESKKRVASQGPSASGDRETVCETSIVPILPPAASGTPDVSILIVLWNCEAFIESCLEAVAAEPIATEVLCFDNASEDRSAAAARALGAHVVESARNIGFPAAINRLLPHARASVTLLLNPDVRLDEGALSRCLRALDEPGVELVGANLRRIDGRPDPPAARRFRSVGTIAVEATGLSHLWHLLDVQYFPTWDRSTSRDVPCINGAFAMLRTDTFRAIGGLDDSVFLYLEDQELCRAVAARAGRIRFVADATAVHIGGGPTEASTPQRRAVAYLHRLDASLEIVRRRQGNAARALALAILMVRSTALWLTSAVRRKPALTAKYAVAIRWLVQQTTGRHPPPPVP